LRPKADTDVAANCKYGLAMAFAVTNPQPVPDRPLTALDIVDGSFAIVRQRPKTVLLILAAFIVPTQFLTALSQREIFAAFDFDAATSGGDPFAGSSLGGSTFGGGFAPLGSGVLSLVATVLASLILPFIGVALTHLVAGWKVGADPSAGECVMLALRKSPAIAGAWILCKLIQVVATIFLIIPLFFAVGMLMLVAPVIASEGVGPVQAIRRSVELVRTRMMPTMGVLASVLFVSWLLAYPVGLLPMVAAFVAGSWGWILAGVLGTFGTMVLTALSVGAAVLLYFDLRNRAEGLDILLQVDRLEAARVD